jgi:hypothetical protein
MRCRRAVLLTRERVSTEIDGEVAVIPHDNDMLLIVETDVYNANSDVVVCESNN